MSKGSGSAKSAPTKGAKRTPTPAAGGGGGSDWYANADLGAITTKDVFIMPALSPTASRPATVSRFGNEIVLGTVKPKGKSFEVTVGGKTALAMTIGSAKRMVVTRHNQLTIAALKAAKKAKK